MEHQKKCIEALNRITTWLNERGIWYVTNPDSEDDKYAKIVLREEFTASKKECFITIKRDGVVMVNIDTRNDIQGITLKNRHLSKSAAFPEWLRIECGYADIAKLLHELDEYAKDYI